MSIIIKGTEMPKEMTEAESVDLIIYYNGNRFVKSIDPKRFVEIPTPHGRLVEEHYPGELKAKQAKGIYILFRSADEDTDRFILEEEK